MAAPPHSELSVLQLLTPPPVSPSELLFHAPPCWRQPLSVSQKPTAPFPFLLAAQGQRVPAALRLQTNLVSRAGRRKRTRQSVSRHLLFLASSAPCCSAVTSASLFLLSQRSDVSPLCKRFTHSADMNTAALSAAHLQACRGQPIRRRLS